MLTVAPLSSESRRHLFFILALIDVIQTPFLPLYCMCGLQRLELATVITYMYVDAGHMLFSLDLEIECTCPFGKKMRFLSRSLSE